MLSLSIVAVLNSVGSKCCGGRMGIGMLLGCKSFLASGSTSRSSGALEPFGFFSDDEDAGSKNT